MKEHVVLVDEDNNKVGIANKYEVHTNQTPLHRAFSLFIFNNSGDLLLQQRAAPKKPGQIFGVIQSVDIRRTVNHLRTQRFAEPIMN